MKKYFVFIFVVCAFVMAQTSVFAEEPKAEAKASLEQNQGNFSYSEGGAPYSFPHAQLPNQNFHPEIGEKGFNVLYPQFLDGMSVYDIGFLVSDGGVQEQRICGVVNKKNPRVEFLNPGNKDKFPKMRYFGWVKVFGEPDESSNSVIARGVYHLKMITNAVYYIVEIKYTNHPMYLGVGIGSGAAKTHDNDESSTSLGAILGFSTIRNRARAEVKVHAFGGNKEQ